MKILVVDDQPDVVAGILDGVNWRALHVEKAYSALSAAEAKDLLLREKIDILLCDIEMPGESGLSLVAWLQKQGRETKCIFLTAHADFPYAQKALQLGAVDYLLQPASYENIEAAIRRAAEQLQEERLSQVYEALGKSVERETLNFRRNVLREYLLEIRRGPKKVAEKAAAFGFLASSRAYRCTLIAVQEPGKNQIDDFLLYWVTRTLWLNLLKSNAAIRGRLTVFRTNIEVQGGNGQPVAPLYCSLGMRWIKAQLDAGLPTNIYCNRRIETMVDRSKTFQIIANAVMILLVLFCLVPFALLIVSSITKETSLVKYGYSFIPREIDLAAYKYLLVDSTDIIRGYGISALVTVVGTICNLTITTLFAYPLSRKDLPARNALAFFLFFTMLFNGGLVPSYIMWTQTFHIKNTLAALLFPSLMMNAFYVIMMRTYFTTNIPDAVIEAARIDGAGELRILSQVVMPMSIPIIATLALLAGLAYWNDWLNGLYYISDDRLFSIQVLLNRMLLDVQFLMSNSDAAKSLQQNEEFVLPSTGIRMAVAVMGALPILVVYPFFQKYFVKGIVIGAVKG